MSHSSCESADRPASARPQELFAWALLASLLLLAVLAAPGLLGYVYTGDDLGAFHLPLRGFYAGQLARWRRRIVSGVKKSLGRSRPGDPAPNQGLGHEWVAADSQPQRGRRVDYGGFAPVSHGLRELGSAHRRGIGRASQPPRLDEGV